ncbi:ATP-binding protein [Paraburkholderia kururiensis]|uniref:histidine kinase n=1 Tax=Paraburkholderia kururiensis TaxID=984307 RepID=A0ABZ0WPV1_9BURK|nr:ATP-binding protein [Paraburkholderia kururiensis]WQD79276.1 ATP-binding protein [Paraburkholderia kururiensis]
MTPPVDALTARSAQALHASRADDQAERAGPQMTRPVPTDAPAQQTALRFPGSIQPHGFLLSFDERGRIRQASANVVDLTGIPAADLIGEPLARVIGEAAASAAVRAVATPGADGTPRFVGAIADPRPASGVKAPPIGIGHDEVQRASPRSASSSAAMQTQAQTQAQTQTQPQTQSHASSAPDPREATTTRPPLAVVAHRHDSVALVELEPALGTADVFSSLYPLVRTFLRGLQDAGRVEDLVHLAVEEIRRITGFGRTLVRRFDATGHGHVIAEAREPGYAPWLDLRFPASELPAEARALYLQNRIQLVADAAYAPVPLVPSLHPDTGRATDLTWASLRSAPAAQVAQMKHRGSGAAMSMAIVVRGRLWGIVSCHHATPRLAPFEVRAACEHIAQMLSLQIEAREDRAEAQYRLGLRERLSRLVAAMANSEHFVAALCENAADLLGLADATGAAIVFDGRVATVGHAPDEAAVEQIVAWLDRQSGEPYATDQLAAATGAPALPGVAGMLAVPISKLFRNYVLWFRPEVVQTLHWSGDPDAHPSAAGTRPQNENRIGLHTETVRGRSQPWRDAELEIAREFRAALLGIVLRRAEEIAQLAVELGRANEELEGFSYTVSHDLRAPLRHIAGFADLLRQLEGGRLSERGRHFVERIVDSARFGGRLVDDMLAFSHMGRAALRVQRVNLDELVRELVAEQQREQSARPIEWHVGKLCTLAADPMLMHVVLRNLLDNAVKFTRHHTRADNPAVIEIAHEPGEAFDEERERRHENGPPLAGYEVIYVRDNGVGFDPRYVDKLFGVFQRLHRYEDFEGTGIGLASVRRIVERHGGKAWATGEPDRGATVYLALPRAAAVPPHSAGETAAAAVARLAAITPGTQPFRNVRQTDAPKE